MEDAVYCTLLMSDSYLPGAMVLAHSLRDNGTKAKLVVLVILESLQTSSIDELKTVYDDIVPIRRIANISPANLYLMNRPDLISTFSKIELWRQTQYRQIVYLDADIVALRAPDELLSLNTDFAAVPDIGWPDCFNTGVMVLRPNLQDYYSLLAFAQRGISFDGADQGLMNMHFRDWQRLSFTYNCTPSGHYQYVPAFRHFQSTISLVHFIGRAKPWNLSRQVFPVEGPYSQLLGQWWAVYDGHYRSKAISSAKGQTFGETHVAQPFHSKWEPSIPQPVHHFNNQPPRPDLQTMAGHVATAFPETQDMPPESEYSPLALHTASPHEDYEYPQLRNISSIPTGFTAAESPAVEEPMEHPTPSQETHEYILSSVPRYVYGEENVSVPREPFPASDSSSTVESQTQLHSSSGISSDLPPNPQLTEASTSTEADQTAITAPSILPTSPPTERPASPPEVGWDASRAPPPADSKPEGYSLPSQTYTMSQDTQLFQPPKSYPDAPKDMYYEVPATAPAPGKPAPLFPWEEHAPPPTRVFPDERSEEYGIRDAASPLPVTRDEEKEDWSSAMPRSSPRLWQTYARTNAWDEVPEIEKYIQNIRLPGRAPVQVISGSSGADVSERRPSTKVADFPTAAERPSLPVTPVPITRSALRSEEQEQADVLPAAEGVPNQEDWNPLERLEKLQRQQSTFLERPAPSTPQEIPKREMPGSKPKGDAAGHNLGT